MSHAHDSNEIGLNDFAALDMQLIGDVEWDIYAVENIVKAKNVRVYARNMRLFCNLVYAGDSHTLAIKVQKGCQCM